MNTITIGSEKSGYITTINLDNVAYWEWSVYDNEGETLYQLAIYFVCHRINKFLATESQRDALMLGFANPSSAIYKAQSEV